MPLDKKLDHVQDSAHIESGVLCSDANVRQNPRAEETDCTEPPTSVSNDNSMHTAEAVSKSPPYAESSPTAHPATDIYLPTNKPMESTSRLLPIATHSVTRATDAALSLCQAIINGNEEQVRNHLTYDNIEAYINNRISTSLLTNHKIPDIIEWTTVLDLACTKSPERLVRLLVQAGANIYNIDNLSSTALVSACLSSVDCMSKLAFLIDYDKKLIMSKDIMEFSCLHYAAGSGLEDVCEMLLRHGADVNARSRQGTNSLHTAAQKNQVTVMRVLVQHGAQIDMQTKNQLLPVHIAAMTGACDGLAFLLDLGIDINVLDDQCNRTPLHYSSEQGHMACITELMRRGAREDIIAKDGMIPLHLAARFGNLDAVRVLTSRHPNLITVKCSSGRTARDWALKYDHQHVAAFISDLQAGLALAGRVREKTAWLVKHLRSPDEHVDILMSSSRITMDEYRIILAKPSRQEQVREMMLTLLGKPDPTWAPAFVQSLRELDPKAARAFSDQDTPRKSTLARLKQVFKR